MGQKKTTFDWGEKWKQMIQNNVRARGMECAQYWEDKKSAENYDAEEKKTDRKKARDIINGIDLTRCSRVLDIGAGPGTVAIQLAPVVEQVTAIEPADGMMACLKGNIASEHLTNIRCIQKKWEDVVVGDDLDPPYDVVIAAFSLGMPDIRDSLKKMDEVSSKYVYLYWFAGIPIWETKLAILWERLNGARYPWRPGADCIFNILYAMGIYPNVEITREEYVLAFNDMDKAVGNLKYRFSAGPWRSKKRDDEKIERIIRRFVKEEMAQEDGALVIRGMVNHAKVWWKKPQVS